jgi:DNA-binding transcriptional ArsR family regulator
MVIRNAPALNRVFRALADPTRRRMLERLATQDRTVNELGEEFTISQPAVTKHLQVLERAGLIRRRKEGRMHYSHARREALRDAAVWMRRYTQLWNDRLDGLEDLLADPQVRKELSRGKD